MNILTKTLTSMGTFENQEMNYTTCTTSSLCNVSTCYDYEKDNNN